MDASILTALLLALLVQHGPANADEILPQISGGKMALPGQFPYQAVIRVINSTSGKVEDPTLCSGALIDPYWVLTAASCVVHIDSSRLQVALGAFDLTVDSEETRVNFHVKEVTIHEEYNVATAENNIALLRLEAATPENEFIASLRLPSKKQATRGFFLWGASVSGWGFTKRDDQALGNWVLRWFDSRVFPNFWCKLFHGSIVNDKSVCLASFWKKGACLGDAGNPVVVMESGKPTLIAIASNDLAGCGNFKPPVFTGISAYLDWISSKADIKLN